MANKLKPISKEYLISSLKGFEKYILNKKYQEKGIQPDWDESDTESTSFIKNKPSALPASDVPEWAKETSKPSYSKEDIGLGNVDNTSDENKPVSTAQQEELDKKIDKTTVATDSTLGLVKSGEDIDVDNDGNVSVKDNSHNHKVENISDLSASASELNLLDGITASTEELNHITGTTDNIQVQLDGKAPTAHTHDDRYYTESEIDDKLTEKFADLKTVAFSGSYDDLLNKPTIPQNKDGVGLENVDNTADIDKPVSTAQQNAINSAVSGHDTSTSAHNDIRSLISDLTTRLNTLADSDDTTLDQLSEIVAYIKNNKGLIDGVTTSKVNVSDIVDDLTSTATNKPISAKQGMILNGLITDLTSLVADKVDKVSGKGLSTNDFTTTDKDKLDGIASGAEVNMQSDWNETDTESDAYIKNKPTSMPASDVCEWAKAETKPSYTKEEVGLGNVDNVSPNDMTPTFARANYRTTLQSGDKLATLFGKISRYLYDLKDVAFSGEYHHIKNALPQMQTVAVCNKWDNTEKKYFYVANLWGAFNEEQSTMCAYFDLFDMDWEPGYERIALGFASFDFTVSQYIDGPTLRVLPEFSNKTTMHNKLFFVYDEIDPYCIQIWVKLDPGESLGIKLHAYTCSNRSEGTCALDYLRDTRPDSTDRWAFMTMIDKADEYTYDTLPEHVTSNPPIIGSVS